MTAASWLLWLIMSGVAALLSVWHYRRRETPGRGRMLLAGLRALAFALVLLLLFDPQLPAGGDGTVRGTQVLLDASLSMTLPADGSAPDTRWQRAAAEARARAGDRRVLLFGDRTRPVAAGELPDTAPGDVRTLLLPALQAAAEAGVRSVAVLTDGGIEDADAVTRWAPRLGVAIELITVGDAATNRSMVEVSAPQWVDAGAPALLEFTVAGTGTAPSGEPVGVVVRRDGRVIARTQVAAPADGRLASGSMELRLEPASDPDGWIRLEVALETGDDTADDDLRTVYIQAGEEPAGVAFVSFRPDWEPRFLAPLLERTLGLPLRGWVRGATGRYVRLGAGLEAGGAGTEDDARRAVERGQLVVLHGLGIDAPAWAHEAARTAPNVLIFPAGDARTLELPAATGAEVQGDFFPSTAIPPSPIAALLGGVELAGTTPLSSLRTVELPEGAWVPLTATRGRQGAVLPLAVAGENGGRRWAIATGSGYWQWSFRGGAERQLYQRFWSALAGWLVRERAVAALPPVRPARMALPRGADIAWVARGMAADSMRVTIVDENGAAVSDTVVSTARTDTAYTSAPAPGHYSYRAEAFSADNVLTGTGVLTVERYSPELARTRVDAARLGSQAELVRGDDNVRGGGDLRRGTPLHATAYPYLLLVALLAAEWILRRRWGLR